MLELTEERAGARSAAHRSAHAGRVPRLVVQRLSWREVLVAGGLMLVAVIAVMAAHIRDDGFTFDDWNVYSDTVVRGGSWWNDVQFLLDQSNIRARPLTGVFWATGMNIFGVHMGVWLAFIAALGGWMGTTVFALLRAVGVLRVPAFVVGAFAVLTPASDALRLWIGAGAAHLPLTLAMSGILVALYALTTPHTRRGVALHVVSLLLYAASLLLVETAMALMCGAVLLYLLVAPWKFAVRRWVVDLVVLGTIYLLVTRHTSYERQTLGGMLDHTWIIIDQSRVLLTTIVFPFGGRTWWALLPFAGLLVTGGLVLRGLPDESDDRRRVSRALALAAGGLVVVALGYAPYAFADKYYSPLTLGVGNRTNGLASVGWAMLVVGVVLLAAAIAFRGLQRRRVLSGVLTAVMLIAIAITYVDRYRTDASYYNDAFQRATATLRTVKAAVVGPPEGSMLYVSGTPLETALGVPVFNSTWDLDGALKYAYNNYDVRGLPVFVGLELDCRRDGIVPVINGVVREDFRSHYGTTYFVDGVMGAGLEVDTVRQCRHASATWPRNPALPS